MNINTILGQLTVDGFNEASQISTLFGVLVSVIFVLASTIVFLYKQNLNKERRIEKLVSDHANKIDIIRKENTDKLDEVRLQIIEKEDKRNRESKEAEKEMINVLNGVNSVIELSEKYKMSDTQQILDKLKEIIMKIDSLK